jgi:hypothetical protein
MKTIATLTFVLLFSIIFAQQKIDGIGKFRIGVTGLSVIAELENELHVPLKRIVSKSDYHSFCETDAHSITFCELAQDTTTTGSHPYAYYPSNSRVYYLSAYKMDKIVFKHIYLTFRDGLLIKFYCSGNMKIDKLLSGRYGQPIMDTVHQADYVQRPGALAPCPLTLFISLWTNDSIKARRAHGGNCIADNISLFDYFEVGNDAAFIQVIKEEAAIAQRANKREKGKKNSK